MFNFARNLCRNKTFVVISERTLKTSESIVQELIKENTVTAAIKLFIAKRLERNKLIETERQTFEFGKRYLAKMMGCDPNTFSQDNIDEAIKYLFPSGLAEPQARPIMTDPKNIYPRKVDMDCDKVGKPHNSFYYTARPAFNSLMHEATYLLEHLKSLEDKANRNQTVEGHNIQLLGTAWLDEKQLSNYCMELIHPQGYANWLLLMKTILKHPYSSVAEQFLIKMRTPMKTVQSEDLVLKPNTDPETGRKYSEAYGQKRWVISEVRVYMPGEGKISINEKQLLEAFPLIANRECILFPLKFTNTIGKVDIIGTITGDGQSSCALSMRLAISRAIACFMPEEDVVRMRLAGLLSQDDRYTERKLPGQPKARKKHVWRKR